MADQKSELKRIEAMHGPYRGSVLDLPEEDANAAIADGWARDPHAPPEVSTEPQEEFTQERLDEILVAAEKAARKFRGEEDPAGSEKAAKPRKTESESHQDDTSKTSESSKPTSSSRRSRR